MPYPFKQLSSSWLYGWYSLSSLCTSILQKAEFCLTSTYKSSLILWTLSVVILQVNPIIFQRLPLPQRSAWTRAVNLHCSVLKVFLGPISFLKGFIFFQDPRGDLSTGISLSLEAPQRSMVIFPLYLCVVGGIMYKMEWIYCNKNMSIILNAKPQCYSHTDEHIISYLYLELKTISTL